MKPEKVAAEMLDRLLQQGASEAEVYLEQGTRLKLEVRQQKREYLKQENFQGMGLRVYSGQRMAFVDTADFSEEALRDVAARAVDLAKMTGEDPANGLPQQPQEKIRGRSFVDEHINTISTEEKMAVIMEVERLALAYDPIIKLSNGATYGDVFQKVTIANSKGLAYSYEATSFNIDISVVAVKNGHKMEGWDSCRRRSFGNLKEPLEMAQRAGRMAVSLVGGEPIPSQEIPVVFDARAGRGLIGGLARAVDGKQVQLGNSFLADKKDQRIATKRVTIVDDGTILWGAGSAPVDGEGVPTRRKVIVEKGILKSFLYDSYAAHKAGTRSTGNGIRESSKSLPEVGATNFYMAKGKMQPSKLIKDLRSGLYVIDTIGFGVNSTVGSYSAGAYGLLIENGRLTRPVAQVTIAGNFLDIMTSINGVGNDLEFNGRIACPSFRVAKMTVAGV